MTWQPHPAHPLFPECKVRCSWNFATHCRAGCFYCGSAEPTRQALCAGARWWTDDEAVQAWQAVFDKYGPVMIDFGGLEAAEELDLCSRVLRIGHAAIVASNLMFDPDEFAAAIPSDRAVICSSFHAHLWNHEPAVFLEKVERVRATGQRVISASVVAHPSLLPWIPDWLEQLKQGDLETTVHPYMGVNEDNGLLYPQSYTPEEFALVDELLGEERTKSVYSLSMDKPQVAQCAAGWLYFAVWLDGRVTRCPGDFVDMATPNFYRGELNLLDRPSPCSGIRCNCESLYQLHLPEGATYP